MDLGEIGGDDRHKSDKGEDWAQLQSSDDESESSGDEEPHLVAGPQSDHNKSSEDSGSELDSEGSPTADDKKKDKQKARRRKQNPAKRNAALLAIVSTIYGKQSRTSTYYFYPETGHDCKHLGQ